MLANKIIALRAPEPEDLDLVFSWENDTALWKYGSTISPFSRYILKEYIASGGGDFYQTRQMRLMIIHKGSDSCIGMIDLFDFDPFHRRAAVGILIDTAWQQQGLATEALRLLDAYSFRFLGIHQLYAHIPVTNEASRKLFEKEGYTTKGILTDWIRVGDQYEDVVLVQKVRNK